MDNDCIDRNFKFRNITLKDPCQILRFKILTAFVDNEPNSISIGCGSYEPLIIGTSYACDISPRAEAYLKKLGYQGKFFVADVRKLPFENKRFKIAVCSEVIEHLNTLGDVVLAIYEINRIADKWVITTPAGYSPDPDHKFHFTEEQLEKLIAPHEYKIFKKDFFFYISNDEEKLQQILKKF